MLPWIICAAVCIGYSLNVLVLYKYDKKGYEQECLPLAYFPFLAFLGHTLLIFHYAVFLNKYDGFWG